MSVYLVNIKEIVMAEVKPSDSFIERRDLNVLCAGTQVGTIISTRAKTNADFQLECLVVVELFLVVFIKFVVKLLKPRQSAPVLTRSSQALGS